MLSLLRTFIGTLFFLCCFGIVLLKNTPKEHRLIFHQKTDLPWVTVKDVLLREDVNDEYTEASFINAAIRTLPSNDRNVKRFLIPTVFNFDLIEEWQWNEQENRLQLTYSYTLNFLSKLTALNKEPLKIIQTFGQSRFENIQTKIKSLLRQHRWEFNGEESFPLTYYLALEGESSWEELNSAVKNGHEDLKTFAQKNEIPVLENTFVLFPEINDEKIRWRAAIEVERYYRTNNSTIRCRRYKGGKALVLTHMGTAKHLPKSWSILQDSLLAHKQNYPLIQKDERTIQDSKNPLEWTTKLYAPIE